MVCGDNFTATSAVINAIFLLAGVYVYLTLMRRIAVRATIAAEPQQTFAWPDAVVAIILVGLFLFNAAVSNPQADKVVLRTNDLLANALVSLALFLFIAAFLNLRGRDLNLLAGFSRLPFWRSLTTAIILLFAAYPLIFLADLVTQRVLGGPSSRQAILELFNGSQTLEQRVLIILLAVGVAPLVEEFVFRFFLYGVIKRYAGPVVGLLASALLFAAVHAHLPSAGPLFVLGVCFTLAYEWSGSIVVTMTMHALFNALTLTALAFPEQLPQ